MIVLFDVIDVESYQIDNLYNYPFKGLDQEFLIDILLIRMQIHW